MIWHRDLAPDLGDKLLFVECISLKIRPFERKGQMICEALKHQASLPSGFGYKELGRSRMRLFIFQHRFLLEKRSES